jgi:hypothetical protein
MAFTLNKDLLIRPESHAVLDVPVPAEGSRVVLINGFPQSGGRDLGEMESAPKIKRLGSISEVKTVNSASPIDYYITNPGAELTITCNRYTAENVRMAMRGELRMMPDGSALVGLGNATVLEGHSVLVSFQSQAGSGVWFYVMLYDAVLKAEIEIEFSPDKSAGMQFVFGARPISGRSAEFALGEHNIPASFIL